MEWLQNFAQEGYALLCTLGIDLGLICVLVVSWLKTKIQNIDKTTFYNELKAAKDEVEVKLRKEYEAKFDAYQSAIVGHLESLENKVLGKIDSNEIERKNELAKQTMELEATIETIKKKASIDEILNG